jgi:hypothetical protein
MNISVRLGEGVPLNKTYGGYLTDDFKVSLSREGSNIIVHFDFTHHNKQDSGQFEISTEVAKRLGWALLRSGMEGTKKQKFEVREGKIRDDHAA